MIRLTPPPPPAPGRAGAPARSGIIQGSFVAGRPTLGTAVQRKSIGPAGGDAFQLPSALAIPSHGGEALPAALRERMEQVLKADFSDVRIHVGPAAAALGARAFSAGPHIHFAPGQYQPQTTRGLQLLGREMAHVVQQRRGRVHNPFGGGLAIVQDPMLEREAERVALAFAAAPPPGQPRPPPRLAPPPPRAAVQMMEGQKQEGRKLRKKVVPPQRHQEYFKGQRPNKSDKSSSGRKITKTVKMKEYIGPNRSRLSFSDEVVQEVFLAKPPSGVFLMYGLRNELGWAPHPNTGGLSADVYLYANPHSLNDVQQNNNRTEYKCKSCGKFFPRMGDMVIGDTDHITVDHTPPVSKRLDSGIYTASVCDGLWVWTGRLASAAKQDYNDPAKLQYMCSAHNSSKGGLKGYEKLEPTLLGSHADHCNYSKHIDVKVVG